MGLNRENDALFKHCIVRGQELLKKDPELRGSMPSMETFQKIANCRTSIEIVEKAFATYASKAAVGFRSCEIVTEGSRRIAKFLPEFKTLTYQQLWEKIVFTASGLRHLDFVSPGEIVSLVGFSSVDHLVAEFACHYLAAVSVPLAKNISSEELESILENCASTTLFCNVEQLLLVVKSMPKCPSVKRIVVIDLLQGDDSHQEIFVQAQAIIPQMKMTSIAEIETAGKKTGKVSPATPAEGTDPLLSIVYTSGSTGTPKGAMFNEKAWRVRWGTIPVSEIAAIPMVSIVFLPQNHMGGRNAIANSIKVGGLAYFTHKSDMSTLFDDIRTVRPTYLHLVPRLSEMVYRHFQTEVAHRLRGDKDPEKNSAMEKQVMAEMGRGFLGDRLLFALTASAPTPPEVMAFVKKCFSIPVVDVLSGTEYGQLFIDGILDRTNVLDFQLVDVPELGYLNTDKPYPRGELFVKTARGISSYFKNEKATRELIDPSGYMRTGDIFEQHGPDHMVWIDRKNNVQKLSQGEFVNIWKVEAAFCSGSRYIKQIYMYGNSTKSYLLAVIVPEKENIDEKIKSILHDEINRLAAIHKLHPYEVPRDFIVETEPFTRDNGLLTSLNKPARPKLKAKYGERLEAMYEGMVNQQTTQLAAIAQDKSLPLTTRVRKIIAAALGLAGENLNLAHSFKESGGDSITATNLSVIVQREFGVRLSVSMVLSSGTSFNDMITFIERAVESATTTGPTFESIHGKDVTVIREKDLRLRRFFPSDVSVRSSSHDRLYASLPKNFLLTGATGFLGRFLCLELLEIAAQRGGTVVCVVRAKTDTEAAQRLSEIYESDVKLKERFHTYAKKHLQVLAGDLEKPHFGLSEARYQSLANNADTIVHPAAFVNHALPYAQLFDANVLGTVELIKFALEGSLKRFNFISTNSLTLALLGERAVAMETDDTRQLGDNWPTESNRHANGYQLSKWAGEVLTQDLFESFGIPANIFRCNVILPPSTVRGQIHADDFFTRLICSVVHTGIYPRSFYASDRLTPHLDGLPADFIAAAIASIGASPSHNYAVYHVNNIHWDDGMSLDTVMQRLVAAGYPLSKMDDHATWHKTFEQKLRQLDPVKRSHSSLAIVDQWRSPLAVESRQKVDATHFRTQVKALRPQGLTDIPMLDAGYFDKCIQEICELRLIDKVVRTKKSG